MKTNRQILALCLFVVFGPAFSSCQQKFQKTTDNPHAYLTDKEKVKSVTTLEEIDTGRFYVMNYTADYKLDKLIEYGVGSIEEMMAFMSENIFDLSPAATSLPGPSAGCSAFAAISSRNGDFLYGRNYDFCHKVKGAEVPTAALMLRTAPAGGKRSISMVDAYWLGFHRGFYTDGKSDLSMLMAAPYELMDGLNEDGFAICVLHLGGKPTVQDEAGKPRIWTSIFMRKLLDTAGNVEEALAIAEGYNLSTKSPAQGNLHFFIADAGGDYAILEYSYPDYSSADVTDPNVMKVFRGKDCYRYVTNFYVDPDMAQHPTLGPLGKRGLWRYDTLRVNLARCNNVLTEEEAMDLLKAVSQASKPEEPTSHTQWSALYNLTQKKVDVSILREYDTRYSFSLQ